MVYVLDWLNLGVFAHFGRFDDTIYSIELDSRTALSDFVEDILIKGMKINLINTELRRFCNLFRSR